jgi:hypothetical protein
LAGLAQFLGLFLAGAGHGWVTPFFVTMPLWILFPATLALAVRTDRVSRLVLFTAAAVALAADARLVSGTIDESSYLRFYLEVNGAVGWLIVVLWLCLWVSWQALLLRSLIAGHKRLHDHIV